MEAEDIPYAAALYEGVRIRAEALDGYFDVNNERGFINVGGMFEVSDARALEGYLYSESDLFLVAEDSDRLSGLMWIGNCDPHFCNLSLIVADSPASRIRRDAVQDLHNLMFLREIIVSNNTFGALGLGLYASSLTCALRSGRTRAVGEIYRVVGYEKHHEIHEIDLFNRPSARLAVKTGAEHIGHMPVKRVEVGSYAVLIESQVYTWHVRGALRQCVSALEAKGVQWIDTKGT